MGPSTTGVIGDRVKTQATEVPGEVTSLKAATMDAAKHGKNYQMNLRSIRSIASKAAVSLAPLFRSGLQN